MDTVTRQGESRRFTVTVAAGLLTDEQAGETEAAIQRTAAEVLASLDLSYRTELVDPMRELRREGPAKGLFDWRSQLLLGSLTPGIVSVVNPFSQPPTIPATPSNGSV